MECHSFKRIKLTAKNIVSSVQAKQSGSPKVNITLEKASSVGSYWSLESDKEGLTSEKAICSREKREASGINQISDSDTQVDHRRKQKIQN